MKDKIQKLKKNISLTLRMLKLSFKISKWPTILIFTFVTGVSLVPFVISFIDNKIIDELIGVAGGGVLDALIRFFIFGIILRVILQILWALISYFEKTQYFEINKYFNLTILSKLSSLDIAYYEDDKTNNLIQNVRDNYSWRPSDYCTELSWIARDIIGIVASSVIILSFSPIIFLIILILTIPVFFYELKMGRGGWTLHNANLTDRRTYWEIGWQLSEERALFDLRVFKIKHYLLDTLRSLFEKFQNKEKAYWGRRNLVSGFLSVLSVIGVIIGEIYVISSVVASKITVGQFSFYTRTFLSFSDSMGSFFHRFARIYENGLYVQDIMDFLDLENVIKDGEDVLVLDGPPTIELKDVTFKYPRAKTSIFDNLNLTIKPGENIAIVGENGAGKSTLIKLISRFYTLDKGQILIEGKDLANLKIDSWYKYISTLFQTFMTYGAFDVKTNIGLGRISSMNNDKKIKEAVKLASAESVIDSFDKKYKQKLSKRFDGGIEPSGGEKQRIALARAFFRDAPVLILDEPTSAIDAKGEAEIFDNLFKTYTDKIVIIISHRFSTVRNADRILVMDKGKIIEEGSHEELLAQKGKYFTMFNLQARGYQ